MPLSDDFSIVCPSLILFNQVEALGFFGLIFFFSLIVGCCVVLSGFCGRFLNQANTLEAVFSQSYHGNNRASKFPADRLPLTNR